METPREIVSKVYDKFVEVVQEAGEGVEELYGIPDNKESDFLDKIVQAIEDKYVLTRKYPFQDRCYGSRVQTREEYNAYFAELEFLDHREVQCIVTFYDIKGKGTHRLYGLSRTKEDAEKMFRKCAVYNGWGDEVTPRYEYIDIVSFTMCEPNEFLRAKNLLKPIVERHVKEEKESKT